MLVKSHQRIGAALIAGLYLMMGSASPKAQELVIGRGSEQQSMDPQFARTGNNQMTATHIFDRLTGLDNNMRVVPALAESWKNVDPNTWEITLREGVKFHDGRPLTLDDVVYSLKRPPTLLNSPASFSSSVANIASIEAIGPRSLRIKSIMTDPLFIQEIGRVYIVSKAVTENASNEDFNKGTAAIGTGPYRFVEWVPADHMTLERNEDYWGPKPAYKRVTVKFISNPAARVAALQAGDVQLVDLVPPAFVADLKSNPAIRLTETESLRLVYLALDSDRDQSPFLTDITGQPLKTNPLKDARVRQALSLLVQRDRLVERVLSGAGTPAGQIVPAGIFGYDPSLTPAVHDLPAAKRLLAEAGYPEGFGITLHASNDRFLQDGAVAQTVGQSLARGGIKMNAVKTLPYSVFVKEATNRQYSFFLFSFGSSTGEASSGLDSILHTFDKELGLGANNRTRYSNPKFDAILEKAVGEFDDAQREKQLQEAARIGFADVGIIPLYWQKVTWASRKDVVYTGRRDEHTLASNAAPVVP
jgi:peptide/nickel transport system substrate-binding protein